MLKNKRKKKVNNSCTTCKFNDGVFCNVGTFYAEEHGTNVTCYNGKLWEGKK